MGVDRCLCRGVSSRILFGACPKEHFTSLSLRKRRLPAAHADCRLAALLHALLHALLRVVRPTKPNQTFATLAGKYLYQLGQLASTLKATSPHYVRCVKPNDIHFRPVDGTGAFNHWKTYRQLLYAGVMEVVKIKKEGFPFRETYEIFWRERCVKSGYHKLLAMDPAMDPKEARAVAWDAENSCGNS